MGRADQKKFKSFFGGKSLSDFRKSVGLNKNVSKDNKSDSNKASKEKKAYGRQENITKDEKATDKAKINVGLGTGEGRQTTDFIDDLKDAYKSGLFTGGTKTKAFMDKYGLTGTDIAKLRTGIDQGLGTRIGDKGGNVLTDYAGVEGILRDRGTIKDFYESDDFIKSRAGEIFEPGMSRFDKLPIYENPEGIFQTAANMSYQYNPILRGFDLLAGGSSQGMRGLYYGREKLGLEGEELNNFAAAVANDRDLYNQMMATPEMQQYELNEFRAEANRNMIANRSDPDPISGTQPGAGGGDDSGGSDDGTTDPGSSYTPAPQNTYTFFDPNLGRYRSGTYDEYLQYVSAKDGGIIQLSQGGTGEDPMAEKERFERENKIVNLRNILAFIRDNKEMPVNTKDQKKVQDETSKLLGDMLKERFTDQEGITELSIQSGDAVRMAEEDQPAKGILNIKLPPDLGPALRKDLELIDKIKDSGLSLLMEALRKSDISTGSANQFIEEALNNFVAAGIIPPNTSYDQLTDPFKDLVTREAAMIANSMATRQKISMDSKAPNEYMYENPVYQMIEGQPEQFEQMPPVIRGAPPRSNVDPRMFNVADGGIIGLKDGGMDDMMQADSLMFRDPSDEGEWEYNV